MGIKMHKIINMLGLNEAGISMSEIISKLRSAQRQDLDEVDFVKEDGTVVRIYLPHLQFDPMMETNY